MAEAYSWSQNTPLDSTGNTRSVFASGYKNLAYAGLPVQQSILVTDADAANLPGLSYKMYGTTDLWKAVLYANGLSDPIQDIRAGMTLNFPTLASLKQWLAQQANNSSPTLTI